MYNTEEKDNLILAENLSLQEWLHLVFNHSDEVLFVDYMFPTDAHLEHYVSIIDERPEPEVLKSDIKLYIKLDKRLWK